MIYLCIRRTDSGYAVHPACADTCRTSTKCQEAEVWYFISSRDVQLFWSANAFSTFGSQGEAERAIRTVDPGMVMVYWPPEPLDF